MNDYIALTINRRGTDSLAASARPGAPVVDDGFKGGTPRRRLRSSLAATLRHAATAEHRWAESLDPTSS